MIIYNDTSVGLRVVYSMPSLEEVEKLSYFIRKPGAVITVETFYEALQFGCVHGNAIQSLLQFMNSIANTEEMHCYLFSITDEMFVVYIPSEALQCSPEEACKDKSLVQRIETVMIHWMDQIKELLNEQEIVTMMDNCGPLPEIDFWERRYAKLLDITQQLEKSEVRHIQNILQLASSLYVHRFCEVANKIQECCLQAKSNLTFLSILKEPCKELAQLKPSQVASKLPNIVNLIRIIWNNSIHYNSSERITGLFRQISNQIIYLCSQSISLDKIFKGHVLSSKQVLADCLQCCTSWKEIYLQASQLHSKYSPKGWDLDETRFFVVIDAFIQRLTDLLEVCDCQHQFARWEDGEQTSLPCFGGLQGEEFTGTLQTLEDTFHHGLQNLCSVDKAIFDVTDNTWCSEFSRFCALVKNLEMMMQNLINSVFKTVYLFEEGVRLLDIFRPVSAREAIKRVTDEKAEEVYNIFNKELKMVNNILNKNTSSSSLHMPKISAHVYKLMGLKHRLETPMEVLQKAYFMPDSNTRKAVVSSCSQTIQVLDELVRKSFSEWSQKLDGQHLKSLEQPLMVRYADGSNQLDINFDKNLLEMFSEICHWKRLKFEIPQIVSDIYQEKDDLKLLRDRVVMLIRNYNRIIGMLSPNELSLFRDKLRFIDEKIQPGLTSLTWLSKAASTAFVCDSLPHVDKLQVIVDDYKESYVSICNLFHQISEALLVRLDENTVYRNLEFEDDQKVHQQSQLKIIQSAHHAIADILTHLNRIFNTDGTEVQEAWVAFTEKVDHVVEEALRRNIKKSMKKLSRAINGDSKTSPNPLLKVFVEPRQASPQTEPKVEFSPSLAKLEQILNILPQLISIISDIERLTEGSQLNPIHVNIEQMKR
ncbi:dynein heavy chain 2, axonemal-like [Parambassis ranga]|uniref:Dynein heavy chain 2, axonemal-like n=1 Tax=Parambassis ranga TaxID=210632 RepID=A0A6P7IZF0_9TELE|nr:dynein heavy chain 2, axonemal-like [Parambassis ranga]